MRVFLGIFLAAIMVSACDGRNEDERRIAAACGPDPFRRELFERAYSGDLAAIDCLIVRADQISLYKTYGEPDAVDSVAWRYLRWIVTGEKPERILELAGMTERTVVVREASLNYQLYLDAAGQLYSTPRYDEKGCFIRPPRVDAIWHAAKADHVSPLCEAAVRPDPNH